MQNLLNKIKYRSIIPYKPSNFYQPEKMLDVISAWKGHDKVVLDIMKRFDIKGDKCLEFGVEFGYSAVVFSNYFNSVKGVDIFIGDIHTAHQGDHYEETKAKLSKYENIELFRADYKDWITSDNDFYDLIHVDIIHTYIDTYKCGLWSAQHSKCCIFHDTESFPDVKRAVFDIAKATGKKFYNYPEYFGLGIVV